MTGFTDPRQPGPVSLGREAVLLDMSKAVLLDVVIAAMAHLSRDGAPEENAVALTLGGRINQTQDYARVLFLFDPEGAASIIAELLALFGRAGEEALITRLVEQKLEAMP